MTTPDYIIAGCFVFSLLCSAAGLIFWSSFKKEADRMGNVMFGAAAVGVVIILVIIAIYKL